MYEICLTYCVDEYDDGWGSRKGRKRRRKEEKEEEGKRKERKKVGSFRFFFFKDISYISKPELVFLPATAEAPLKFFLPSALKNLRKM